MAELIVSFGFEASTGLFVYRASILGLRATDALPLPLDPNPPGLRWINPVKVSCSANVLSHLKAQGKTLSLLFDDFPFW